MTRGDWRLIVTTLLAWTCLLGALLLPQPHAPHPPPAGFYQWDASSLTLTVTSRDVAVCLPRLHRAPDCRDVVGWTGDR